MSDKLKFGFPLRVLIEQGELIVIAAEKPLYAALVNARLPQDNVAGAKVLIGDLRAQTGLQKSMGGDLGNLTLEQDEHLKTLKEKINAVRKTARLAFKDQDVKLREEFQVGINKPQDLAAILQRANIILTALQKPANREPMKLNGWTEADTAAFESALNALDDKDEEQEGAKLDRKKTTSARNLLANDLYDHLLKIQNAANLQWPASRVEHKHIREEFLLGHFPPATNRSGEEEGDTPTPENPQPPTP